jgi:ABC-type antimicrobial peptide transport system permease subunit
MFAFFAMRHLTPELSMAVTPKLIVEVAAAAFVSCTLGSLVAVRRVLQLDPAIVFRG